MKVVREDLRNRINSKYEHEGSKLGCYMGLGLLSAGGGNSIFNLLTTDGHMKIKNIIGAYLFTFYWYWYPMVNLIGLALEPSYVAGVVKNLKIPRGFKIKCNAPPSHFKYYKTDVVEENKEK